MYINPICPTFFWRCARVQCAPTFYSSIQPYISSLCHPKNHSIYPIWYGDEFFSDPVASRSHICVLLAVLCRLNAWFFQSLDVSKRILFSLIPSSSTFVSLVALFQFHWHFCSLLSPPVQVGKGNDRQTRRRINVSIID